MSKAIKRGNSWNIRVYDYTDANGVQHNKSFTADTKIKAELMAAEFKANRNRHKKKDTESITVREAINRYIELSEVLSPTTLESYEKIKKYAFKTIMDRKVSDLDDEDIQTAINLESKRKTLQTKKQISAKTVKNEWGLLSAALKLVCKRQFIIKLPPIKKSLKTRMLPELDALLGATVGTIVELPMYLACKHSLRMSEIRGLTCKSLVGDELFVNQVILETSSGNVVRDITKTENSTRSVLIYPRVKELIVNSDSYKAYLKDGIDRPLVPMTRHKIYYHFEKAVKSAGIEMYFHDLRHIFASLMLTKIGAAEVITQGEGGWKTDHVMKQYYSQGFESERRASTMALDRLFEKSLEKNITKNITKPSKEC